ncbi:hypothetical protein Poli38472_009334 [Pythium oligandrum]|uniref:FAD dependent oxidoreductase domain-containing protein n=1 Tax=Pythium oligandrum TaxID=41045 RepID=A0A8K1CKJ4_PYTOL|nr:hypothetical protein Poli38472_009334 [Pythium oligandrum]|eukprot:TMW65167.1 hypothetical protein Poli38472_009334 [Pythium oligandrum]
MGSMSVVEPLEPPSATAKTPLRSGDLSDVTVTVPTLIHDDAIPAHLRDHVVAVNPTASPPVSGVEGGLLPPLSGLTSNKNKSIVLEPTRRIETKRVIVCGAGIVGLTTCYYLAMLGHEVLCVEKEAGVGTQASYCNGAFLDPAMYSSWADVGLLKRVKSAGSGKPSRTIAEASARTVASRSNGTALEASGAPAAAAAGENSASAPSPAAAGVPPPPVRTTVGGVGWRGVGKPMKIEFSALRDPSFWKWGYKFWKNSKKQKADEHSRTIRELGFYSMIKLRELQAKHKKGELDMDETAEGTIEVFRSGEELDHVWESDRKKHLSELGMDLQPLDSSMASQVESALRPEIYGPGAILSAYGTSGDVHKMCEALYRLCMREGVMFRFNTEIMEVLTDRTRVIAIQTRRGALIEGDEFVLALGNSTAPVARRAGLPLSIYPVKGYVISVPVNRNYKAPTHNIYAGGLALVSPLGRWLRISGGVDFANPNRTQSNQRRFDWLLSQAKTLFPDDYLNTKEMKTHVCWRPVTPDDVPLIGRTRIENLFVNAGHGSKGWTLSFGAAALLADCISGLRPQLDMSKFDPHRI